MRNLKTRLALGLTAALALAGTAHASDGTNGTVNAETCTIVGNGASGTSSFTVTLPAVSTHTLNAIGATAGRTPFTIGVTGCSGGTATTVNTYFEAGANVNASGRLSNASGTATGVDMQLLTSTSSVITMGAANGSQGTTAATLSGNAATQTFYLQYYATSATPAAGTYISTFTYTLVYV